MSTPKKRDYADFMMRHQLPVTDNDEEPSTPESERKDDFSIGILAQKYMQLLPTTC